MDEKTYVVAMGDRGWVNRDIGCLEYGKSIQLNNYEGLTILDGHPNLYTEKDLAKARAEGQAEAWALARKIAIPNARGGYSYAELTNIFGEGDCISVLEKHQSFAEAQAKVVADEQRFRPGDIVVNKYGTRAIVTCVNAKSLYVMYSDGSGGDQNSKLVWSGKCPDLQWKKTGKHIDLDEFFEAIKGKKESGNE